MKWPPEIRQTPYVENDQLRHVGAEAVNRNEDGVGQAGGDRRSEVSFVGFVEFLAKVIPSVERDDHLEIVQALLDLARSGRPGSEGSGRSCGESTPTPPV